MASKIRDKKYRIDVARLNRARRVLGARTETETIHRALDMVADEIAPAWPPAVCAPTSVRRCLPSGTIC
jgi:hypothetical protein